MGALVAEGKNRREARMEVAEMRAEHWPPTEVIVAAAVAERLAQEDLAGPWETLTAWELRRVALSGRWPGPDVGGLVKRAYALPDELALALRTASWRVSSGPLERLYAQGLVGGGGWSADQLRTQAELVEQLHSPGRIVRQALVRYGPQPPGK